MNLCETCTRNKCTKNMKVTKYDNLTIIKCLDYVRNEDKIQGYIAPKNRTAKPRRTVMGLYSPDWR